MMGGLYFTMILKSKEDATIYHVEGASSAPVLIRFLHSQGIVTEEGEAEADITLIIPADYQAKIANGYLPTITIRTDISENMGAAQQMRNALQAYAAQMSASRLIERGVSPLVMQPYIVDIHDTGSVSLVAKYFLPMFILMIMIVPIYAIIPAGVDATAGERERNAALPMLLLPIPAIYIPIGKLLMLVLSGLITLLIAITSGFIAYSNVSLPGFALEIDISFVNGLAFLFISLPSVFLLSAIVMGFASFAKSFKEGQTYATLAGLVPFILLGIGFALDEKWRAFMPLCAEITVIANILSGKGVALLPWSVAILCYLVVVAGCMMWISKSMRKQLN
jgi:sodium transport system permease protein